MGALGIYGRFVRKPPLQWRWLALSLVPAYAATFLYNLGFMRFTSDSPPDDWWLYQVAGMEVRASIAETIATSRARLLIREVLRGKHANDLLPASAFLLGSASRDARIQFQPLSDVVDISAANQEDGNEEPSHD